MNKTAAHLLLAAVLAGSATAPARAQIDIRPVAAQPQPSTLPADWQHGVFMEVFVRGYQDSNGDGVGDLRGLTRRLDYLKKLGVSGLWLMPITASADHDHGYATVDFRAIEPQYGTLADFDELVREAHKRGIGIVMDYVVNHASYQFAPFQQAMNDPASPWRSWFVWNANPGPGWDIWGKYPWYDVAAKPWDWKGEFKDMPPPKPGARDTYFGTFGPDMPDFNLRNPTVVQYHEDSLRFWLNRGLDGYRLDAVPHLIENNAKDWNDQPESRALTKHFQDLIKSYPNRYVVCEATAEPRDYGEPELCGGAFAFGLHEQIMKAAQGDAEAVQQVASYYQTLSPTMATFLHNHDIFTGHRVWDQLKGDEARYRLAAASYLLLPGTPFVYYGEEIGLAGVDGEGDAPLRAPMSWTASNRGADGFSTSVKPFRPLSLNRSAHNAESQQRDANSLFNFYRTLIALRRQLPSLAHGSYEADQVTDAAWTFQRVLGREHTVVAINYGDEPATVSLGALPASTRAAAVYPSGGAALDTDAAGHARITLPPMSLRVFNLQAPPQRTPLAMPTDLKHVEPPNWWVGLREPRLQLMLHGDGVAEARAALGAYPGVRLVGQHRLASPNYLFVDLNIAATAAPGTLMLKLTRPGQQPLAVSYILQSRANGSADRSGFGPKDAIYLVVPDRFGQGGSGQPGGMKEGIRRDDPGGRHGGDLAGMRQHLDYIAGMGFTQVWPTPLVANDSAKYSYHGYAATDFYRIDPRFGSNDDYVAFAADARAKGLGVIQDVVLNHIGSNHWWMTDLPTPDWVNQWANGYTETHHARMTLQDPYAAPSDRRRFTDGWFSRGMPDLNQRVPELAAYLTQMSVWWIETAGLSGLRTDTYSYSDREFLTRWSARLLKEYPRLNIVGEEWSPHPAVVAYWQRGKRNHDGYVSNAPSLMDFPLHGALLEALNEPDSHNTGFTKLYEALAHDFVYADPSQLVVFDGNHDTPRLFSVLKRDVGLTKMALAYLATTRRIPQVFYGSEILMQSPTERDDGKVRADMPGGWTGDTVNAFTGTGLDAQSREMQDWTRRLFTWRKTASVIHDGALMQYAPQDGCYVFFRYDANRTVMVVLNKNAKAFELPLARFPERVAAGARARDVMTGQALVLGERLTVPARSPLILEIER